MNEKYFIRIIALKFLLNNDKNFRDNFVKKISDGNKGRIITEEHRKKISELQKLQEQQNSSSENKEQNDKKEEQPPKKEQISQENSDQILKAFIQEEKLIQQQLQQQKVNDTKRVLDKNL